MVEQAQYSSDDYWSALYRRRRIIALVVFLSALFTGYFSLIFTPLYQATVQFYVPQEAASPRGIAQQALVQAPGLREQARTYVAVLESPDAHRAVADQLEDRSLEEVMRAADFDVTPASSLVVYARDKDPAVATRMVELFLEYFKSFHSLRLDNTLKIVEQPTVSNNPVFPLVGLNVLVGAIGGLLTGIIYALFLDHLQVRTLAKKLKELESGDWFEEAVKEELRRSEER